MSKFEGEYKIVKQGTVTKDDLNLLSTLLKNPELPRDKNRPRDHAVSKPIDNRQVK